MISDDVICVETIVLGLDEVGQDVIGLGCI